MKNQKQHRGIGNLPMGESWAIGRMPILRNITALALLLVSVCAQGQGQGQGFTNTLGMKMVPVPKTEILMGTTEVTVDQYKAAGLGYEAPEFAQTGSHPAVNVSWNDAQKYCAWLSQKEGKKYRLPTDYEWSCAVGIGAQEGKGGSPESKSEKLADVYPWGSGWPPPENFGNYAGEEREFLFIIGFRDGHIFTAPVGSYRPNSLGIYDLGGNVEERCEDKYDSSTRVVRGASWGDDDPVLLLSSRRSRVGFNHPEYRTEFIGFRVVVER